MFLPICIICHHVKSAFPIWIIIELCLSLCYYHCLESHWIITPRSYIVFVFIRMFLKQFIYHLRQKITSNQTTFAMGRKFSRSLGPSWHYLRGNNSSSHLLVSFFLNILVSYLVINPFFQSIYAIDWLILFPYHLFLSSELSS